MTKPGFDDIKYCEDPDVQSFSNQIIRMLKKSIVGSKSVNLIMRIVASVTWEYRRKQFIKAHKIEKWRWTTDPEKSLIVTPSVLDPSVWNEQKDQDYPEYNSECLDHIDVWLKGGKPYLMTSQPYFVSKDDLKKLIAHCDKYGIDFQIDAESFYFPGHSIRILLKKGNIGYYDACAHKNQDA